jgi:hypothetical protein
MEAAASRLTACRACGDPLDLAVTMIDLGLTPLANSYLRQEDLSHAEPKFRLRAIVCSRCLLVQLDEVADAGHIFSDYAYFSSYSESWLLHASRFAAHVTDRFSLDAQSQVVEIASNDGYLLKNFVARGIRALGIEPARNVAEAALANGIDTRVAFFNSETAAELVREGVQADLTVANNVLAHVPALNDFVEAFRILLKRSGVATFEFPHLLRLVEERQFDTIYHEHFSYFSLLALERLFANHGLSVFDVQELPTHGGSLRLFVQHVNGPHETTGAGRAILAREEAAGFRTPARYARLGEEAVRVRDELVSFLRSVRASGKRVAAYGAPAKGNTLLTYCGIGTDLISLTVDRSPHKQNRYLPGSHIPIHDPAVLRDVKPDYLVVLPWNLRDEIISQMRWIGEWGGQFVLPIPELTILQPPVNNS